MSIDRVVILVTGSRALDLPRDDGGGTSVPRRAHPAPPSPESRARGSVVRESRGGVVVDPVRCP